MSLSANIIGFSAMGLGAVIFFIWQNKLSIKAKKAAELDLATQSAKNAALWLLDYHNPVSVNYDPIRIADEQAASDAAWLLDPRNPDSVNYNENA